MWVQHFDAALLARQSVRADDGISLMVMVVDIIFYITDVHCGKIAASNSVKVVKCFIFSSEHMHDDCLFSPFSFYRWSDADCVYVQVDCVAHVNKCAEV